MKTHTINVYSFEELSPAAKETARDRWRKVSARDCYFAECVLEDACEVAARFGLNIHPADICWSGFYSQGDGASFTGSYHYKEDALVAVAEYAPMDVALHAIVASLASVPGASASSLAPSAAAMDVHVYTDDRGVGVAVSGALRSFANWIYQQLEIAMTSTTGVNIMTNIDIIHKASLRPISGLCYGSRTKAASRAMAGRTYYYEPGTLRFFSASVSRLHVDVDGIAMVALERLNADMEGTRRGWRVTIHDLTGRQLNTGAFGATQRGLDTLLCSKRAADKEFNAACNALDVSSADVLRDAITSEIANHESALTALRGVQSRPQSET